MSEPTSQELRDAFRRIGDASLERLTADAIKHREPETIVCPTCEGDGYARDLPPQHFGPCKTCNGTGIIEKGETIQCDKDERVKKIKGCAPGLYKKTFTIEETEAFLAFIKKCNERRKILVESGE